MIKIDDFRAEHREIASLMDRFAAMLAAETPPEPLAFLQFRREFGRVLNQHLKREDWTLYPHLMASPRPEVRGVAQRLHAEIGAFEAAFGAYARCWTSVRICENWELFREESEALIRRLQHRILVEEQELYPLVERRAAA